MVQICKVLQPALLNQKWSQIKSWNQWRCPLIKCKWKLPCQDLQSPGSSSATRAFIWIVSTRTEERLGTDKSPLITSSALSNQCQQRWEDSCILFFLFQSLSRHWYAIPCTIAWNTTFIFCHLGSFVKHEDTTGRESDPPFHSLCQGIRQLPNHTKGHLLMSHIGKQKSLFFKMTSILNIFFLCGNTCWLQNLHKKCWVLLEMNGCRVQFCTKWNSQEEVGWPEGKGIGSQVSWQMSEA